MNKILLFLFLLICTNCYPQSYQQQRGQILTYNILLNSGIGTLGYIIKNKNRNKIGFIKSFVFSSVGGLIKHQSKSNLNYIVHNRPLLSTLNLGLYFIGDSFVRNSIENDFTFNNWELELYGLRTRVRLEKKKISFRYSPYSLIGLVGYTITGNKFNLFKSIQYGVFYFEQNHKYNNVSYGSNFYNCISINTRVTLNSTVPHELIHQFQHFDYFPLTKFYVNDQVESKSLFLKTYQKYFITDINHFYPLYYLNSILSKTYYSNFYEFEAEHYGSHKFVLR